MTDELNHTSVSSVIQWTTPDEITVHYTVVLIKTVF